MTFGSFPAMGTDRMSKGHVFLGDCVDICVFPSYFCKAILNKMSTPELRQWYMSITSQVSKSHQRAKLCETPGGQSSALETERRRVMSK